jgi:hypothetical protein
MKRAFIVEHKGGQCIATSNGRIIVATTEQEIANGPSRHTTDLDGITVTEWMKEAGVDIDAR